MDHGNRKFVFQFSIDRKHIQSLLVPSVFSLEEMEEIRPHSLTIKTAPFHVVRRKFAVQVDTLSSSSPYADEESGVVGNSSSIPHIWYKDEGGKEHGIELTISLLDHDLSPHTGEDIPFFISLHYHDNESPLLKPNLLTISPEGGNIIDKSTGKCFKKLRINDISKNHQRQCFIIRVSPDISKSSKYFDVAFVDSPPIEVRSKRSKRHRDSAPGTTLNSSQGSQTLQQHQQTNVTNSSSAPQNISSEVHSLRSLIPIRTETWTPSILPTQFNLQGENPDFPSLKKTKVGSNLLGMLGVSR